MKLGKIITETTMLLTYAAIAYGVGWFIWFLLTGEGAR